ncbi:MAG TPA: ABC transporter substrate-binding protein [Anaerolineales bacterium]|nr:ABC transporter substrate-binding protein [Anaerolineales bacterium]
MNNKRVSHLIELLWMAFFATACTGQTATPAEISIAQTATSTALILTATDTPSPSPTSKYPLVAQTFTPSPIRLTQTARPHDPNTLVICSGDEPDTLYIYGGSMLAQSNVLEAIYDGPIDYNDYGYQPVILEKLPSLADGDAVIQPVTVREGDMIVDADGNVTTLAGGVTVRPAGCRASECAITYESGEIQMDQMSATFTLIEDLHWSDDRLLTAQDSTFSYHVAKNCGYPWGEQYGSCGSLGENRDFPGGTLARTASYTALDDRMTQWVGLPGYLDPYYMTNFAHPLPRHVLLKYEPEQLPDVEEAWKTPVGWGPYVIEEWEPGSHFRLRRNPYYFRADEGLPKFEVLIIRSKGQNTPQNLAALLTGECDLLTQTTHIDDMMAEFLELDKGRELQLIASPGATWEHADFGITPVTYDNSYQFGDRPDFFGDVRTRQAIAMCMDREAVADAIYLELSEVVHSYIPDSHPLFNADAPQYDFNPQAGMVLLDEVGWRDHDGDPATPRVAQDIPRVPDGTPLSFNFWTTTATQRQTVTQMLAENLTQCGIELKLDYWTPDEFFANGPEGPVFGRQFDMAEFAWLSGVIPPCDLYLSENIPGPPDTLNPDGTPRFPSRWGDPEILGDTPSNNIGYHNPAFDETCRRALSLLPGEPGYEAAHREAQAIWMTDLPSIPLYLRIKMAAARGDFCGFDLNPIARSDTWNIEEFGFAKGCGDS